MYRQLHDVTPPEDGIVVARFVGREVSERPQDGTVAAELADGTTNPLVDLTVSQCYGGIIFEPEPGGVSSPPTIDITDSAW